MEAATNVQDASQNVARPLSLALRNGLRSFGAPLAPFAVLVSGWSAIFDRAKGMGLVGAARLGDIGPELLARAGIRDDARP